MRKILFIIVFLLPVQGHAIDQREIEAISDIVKCSEIGNDNDKLDCFEKNSKNLKSIFPIVTLEKDERKKEILKIEKKEKEGNFGILQTINPIEGNKNKDLDSLSSTITKNYWVNFGKIKIELENGQIWKQHLGGKTIWNLLQGPDGTVWATSLGDSLYSFDGDTWKQHLDGKVTIKFVLLPVVSRQALIGCQSRSW